MDIAVIMNSIHAFDTSKLSVQLKRDCRTPGDCIGDCIACEHYQDLCVYESRLDVQRILIRLFIETKHSDTVFSKEVS